MSASPIITYGFGTYGSVYLLNTYGFGGYGTPAVDYLIILNINRGESFILNVNRSNSFILNVNTSLHFAVNI